MTGVTDLLDGFCYSENNFYVEYNSVFRFISPVCGRWRFRAMRKMRSTRIPCDFEAEIVAGSTHFSGVIRTVSEDGIHIRTESAGDTNDLTPGRAAEIEFRMTSGETLSLLCKVIWSDRDSLNGSTNNIGLLITEKPEAYVEFFQDLYSSYIRIL